MYVFRDDGQGDGQGGASASPGIDVDVANHTADPPRRVALDEGGQRLAAGGLPQGMQLLHESCFTTGLEVTCTLQLQLRPGARLIVVPATFAPAQFGPFRLSVHGDLPVQLRECS